MPPKNPWKKLEVEWRDGISGMEPEEIRLKIAEIAIDNAKFQKAKKLDKDLAERKAKYDGLVERYKDGSTMYSLQFKLAEDDKAKVADLTIIHDELLKEKEEDDDLRSAKDAVNYASSTYTDNAKMAKLRIKFCRWVLEQKGKA